MRGSRRPTNPTLPLGARSGGPGRGAPAGQAGGQTACTRAAGALAAMHWRALNALSHRTTRTRFQKPRRRHARGGSSSGLVTCSSARRRNGPSVARTRCVDRPFSSTTSARRASAGAIAAPAYEPALRRAGGPIGSRAVGMPAARAASRSSPPAGTVRRASQPRRRSSGSSLSSITSAPATSGSALIATSLVM